MTGKISKELESIEPPNGPKVYIRKDKDNTFSSRLRRTISSCDGDDPSTEEDTTIHLGEDGDVQTRPRERRKNTFCIMVFTVTKLFT